VKTSGRTEFDVAAIDTVLSAAPYKATPEAIRSGNGTTYLRWAFHRNWRQCAAFNVSPHVLAEAPDGVQHPVTSDDGSAGQPVNPATTVTDRRAVFAAHRWLSAFVTARAHKLVDDSDIPFHADGGIAVRTTRDLRETFNRLIRESGPMKDWKLVPRQRAGRSQRSSRRGRPCPPGPDHEAALRDRAHSHQVRRLSIDSARTLSRFSKVVWKMDGMPSSDRAI
jgi:hypothetical protein